MTSKDFLRGFIIVFLFVSLQCLSLEKNDGRIKLIINERSGQFTIQAKALSGNASYVPVFAEIPSTNQLFIGVTGKGAEDIYTSNKYTKTLLTGDDIGFEWKSLYLKVTQRFEFVSSIPGRMSDGILITLSLENISEEDLQYGVLYILDTHLGEVEPSPFALGSGSALFNEKTITNTGTIRYWVAGPVDEERPSLMVTTGMEGTTRPDKVIFANWNRLTSKRWSYETPSNRDFKSYNPLSVPVNDSAVGHYYGFSESGVTRQLLKGSVQKISFVMGQYRKDGFNLVTEESSDDNLDFADKLREAMAETTESQAMSSDLGVQASLSAISGIIDQLNMHLDDESSEPSDQELKDIRDALETLSKSR